MEERFMNIVAKLRRVGFYATRLRKEKITQGLIMSTASLALVLQLTAGIFPIAPGDAFASTANNNDNIIYQGVTSTSDLLAVYDSGVDGAGHSDLQQIYTQFGVTRADLANTHMGTYQTNDFGGAINTLGRLNWGTPGRSAVAITGTGTTIYTGPFLRDANSQPFVQQALIGTRASDGQWFAITLNCGNLVYVVPPPAPPKPAAACDSLTVQQISRTSFAFTAKASVANGATVSSFHYVIAKDGTTVTDQVIATSGVDSQISQSYSEAGDYTATVTVQTSLGDQISANCTKAFTVTPPPVVNTQVCELATNKVVTIDEKDFDSSKYSKNLEDCQRIVVCDLATFTQIVIKEADFDSSKQSKDLANCHAPVQIEVCDLKTHTIVTINEKDFDSSTQSKDTANCVTPPELPHTGVGSALGSVAGLGSVVASLGYYISSRRGLLSAFLNQ